MINSTLIDDPDFAPAGSAKSKENKPFVQAELANGERLIWTGQPRRSRRVGLLPTGYRALCLVVGGFASLYGLVFVMVGLFDQPYTIAGPLIIGFFLGTVGLLILAAGLRDLVGVYPFAPQIRAWGDPIQNWFDNRAQVTYYALTDRRIILWEPHGFNDVKVRSLRPIDLNGMSRTQRGDGSGDLLLEMMSAQSGG